MNIRENRAARRIAAVSHLARPEIVNRGRRTNNNEMLEEVYPYIAMPAPAWGAQFVYADLKAPELAVVVREDDCV